MVSSFRGIFLYLKTLSTRLVGKPLSSHISASSCSMDLLVSISLPISGKKELGKEN
jgi:hypothetical protein